MTDDAIAGADRRDVRTGAGQEEKGRESHRETHGLDHIRGTSGGSHGADVWAQPLSGLAAWAAEKRAACEHGHHQGYGEYSQRRGLLGAWTVEDLSRFRTWAGSQGSVR